MRNLIERFAFERVLLKNRMLLEKLKVNHGNSERGASLIILYLAILMFLYIAILFLDIPYMERVGRTVQKAADAACLAGVVQLTRHNNSNPTVKLAAWQKSKRAAIAILKESEIPGVSNSLFASLPAVAVAHTSVQDQLDPTAYGYDEFSLVNGGQSGTVTIKRGVYQRPAAWVPPAPRPQIFYPVERGDPNRGGAGADQLNCKAIAGFPTACAPTTNNIFSASYSLCTPFDPLTSCVLNSSIFKRSPPAPSAIPADIGTGAAYTSTADGYPPVHYVADGMEVKLTISGIPTLFAKILGFNSFVSITRTATSGPM